LTYQLNWQMLPGLRGLSCSNFRAVATPEPDRERGVAIECPTEDECTDLLRRLEANFADKRFSNNAAAFESVKAYVLEWVTNK